MKEKRDYSQSLLGVACNLLVLNKLAVLVLFFILFYNLDLVGTSPEF